MCVPTFLVSPTASLHHGHDPGADGGIENNRASVDPVHEMGFNVGPSVYGTAISFCRCFANGVQNGV